MRQNRTCIVDGGRRSSSQLHAIWMAASLIGLGRIRSAGPFKLGFGPWEASAGFAARLPAPLPIASDGGSSRLAAEREREPGSDPEDSVPDSDEPPCGGGTAHADAVPAPALRGTAAGFARAGGSSSELVASASAAA
jgi:hypothetical protein